MKYRFGRPLLTGVRGLATVLGILIFASLAISLFPKVRTLSINKTAPAHNPGGWTDFVDTNLGYRVSYPKAFSQSYRCNNCLPFESIQFLSSENVKSPIEMSDNGIYISIQVRRAPGVTLEALMQSDEDFLPDSKLSSPTPITVNGLTGIRYTIENSGHGAFVSESLLANGDLVYDIEFLTKNRTVYESAWGHVINTFLNSFQPL
jgi:hypothetical protein